MQQNTFIAIAIVVFVAVLLGAAIYLRHNAGRLLMHAIAPPPTRLQAYPDAPPMPPAVDQPIDTLLADYENRLRSKAPAVLAALQPGLSDAQIDAIESEHHFQLTPDLRALYRWRNGTPRSSRLTAFPDHRFLPLGEAVEAREAARRQIRDLPRQQRELHAEYAGHSDPWIGLLLDVAGDGFHLDSTRTELQGSFFFHFREDGSYLFFPSFRNYLAAILSGGEDGIYTFADAGVTTADFVRAQKLLLKYGSSAADGSVNQTEN